MFFKKINTFVWTVNLTLSRSLSASDMSTNNDVSERSIVSLRGCLKRKKNSKLEKKIIQNQKKTLTKFSSKFEHENLTKSILISIQY